MIVSKERNLIVFSSQHLRLIGFLIVVFVIALIFRIHGYSLPEWRAYIDGSVKKEILLGESRGIRSDDWAVEIPLMLAQLHHNENDYPVLNENIGNGLNMFIHTKVPIFHFLTLFRPTVWGFFVNGDFGLAWMWWLMVLGLFYAYFLVFMLISKNEFYLSCLGGIFLVFSPFFQFWSFHMAEIPIFMALIFISFVYICFSENTKTICFHAILLGWFMGCYALNFIYPPYQVSCAYLLLFMMIGFFLDRRPTYDPNRYFFYRVSALMVGLAIFFWAIVSFFSIVGPEMNVMMATVYPGNRFCVGGDHQLWLLFRNNLLLPAYALFNIDWSRTPLGNICESSSFFFLFIPVSAVIIYDFVYRKKIKDLFSLVLIGYFILMLIYNFVGFHPEISKYSLFYMMQSFRSVIGLGIGNIILIVAFLSKAYSFNLTEKVLITLACFLLILHSGGDLFKFSDQIPFRYVLLVSFLNGMICWFMLSKQRMRAFSFIVLFTFFSTFWFNPIVTGGTEFLYENELSKKIVEIDKSADGETVWLTYGSWVIANLPRILGVRSLNGTHPYPQFDLWKNLDPEIIYKEEYNRYGHVSFTAHTMIREGEGESEPALEGSNSEIIFHSPSPDQIFVFLKPSPEILKRMGVTHVLVSDNPAEFDKYAAFEKVFSYSDKHIYKVN